MTFDPRTATPEEFEAEARRLHGERLQRIDAMTDEEKAACEKFMMPGLMDRYRRLELNQLVPAETVDLNIAECVKHYRIDREQSSPEYEAARMREVEADRRRKTEERMARQRAEVEDRNRAAEAARSGAAESLAEIVRGLDRSDRTLFTRSGRPRCRALSRLAGRRVGARERDAAWKLAGGGA